MMRFLVLFTFHLVLLSFFQKIAESKVECPQLKINCTCQEDKKLIIVKCDGIEISEIAQSLGTSIIDQLFIKNSKDVKIEALPFNGLRTISITDSKIENISTSAWKRFEKTIEIINLRGNKLKTVPVFGSLPSLIELNLMNNEITTIPEKALSSLSSIHRLSLGSNKICDFPPKALDALKSTLSVLDISGNCLNAIPAQIIRNAANLERLDLSSNNISEINNFELMNLPSLRELRLHNNILRRVHPMAFMNVPQLQLLYLQNNIISSLDGNRLQAFKKLEVLDISNNVLSSLPSLKDLPNLKRVKVDGNLISKIETLSFSNNPKLQLISMQNNNIVQIARNSFDSLDNLINLLLGNNSISKIERGMLDGIRNLQVLSFRNNSLKSLDSMSFPQLHHLTKLDLGHNQIRDVQEGTFDRLGKLFWLDLSNNRITGFKANVFTKKISNILLDGNPLICDESFNEFLTYLVVNKVRTFLPFQPEIKCTGPEKYAGVRLKDLMMKKANETINEGTRLIGLSRENKQQSLISSFLPSLGPMNGFNQAEAGLPFVRSITQSIPALRTIPGLGGQNVGDTRSGSGGAAVVPNQPLNSAIEQFTGPLVRFATGGQPVASDIQQLIRSIPNMVVNVPGFGDVDLSKMDPAVIQYVLNGGQIPGFDKSVLDSIVKQTMQKMHMAASANLAGNPIEEQDKVLPPLEKLPSEMVTQVMSGKPLPGLTDEQTKTVMEYYTQQLPTLGGIPARPVITNSTDAVNKQQSIFSPAMFDLLKMLPPGYNLSKIPVEVINAVSKGEVPDMRMLPQDLLEHFKSHTNSLTSLFAGATSKNITIDEILAKLPVFARPELSTFVPYDINELSSEMRLQREVDERHRKIRIITAISLAFVGAITIVVLIFFVNYTKKQRRERKSLMRNSPSGGSSTPPGSGTTTSLATSQINRAVAPSPIRPCLGKTSVNRTLESTFGHPQLCSTMIDTPRTTRSNRI